MRPVIADLCCREGGAGEGYRRAGFEVVGVDIEPFDYYPGEFDAIHASPPCQKFINRGNSARVRKQDDRPDLITPMRPLRAAMDMPWASAKGCAEAIPPPYTELIGAAIMQAIKRPKPHADCPPCPDCELPCGTAEDAAPGWLRCCACGHAWTGTAAELKQARRADAAYAEVRELEEVEQRWPEHMRDANRRMLDRPPQPARVAEQLELEVGS